MLAAQIFPQLPLRCCIQRAVKQLDKVRKFAVTRYAAKSWACQRRVVARIEATPKGADVRYVVTSTRRAVPSISTRGSVVLGVRPRT